MGELTDLIFSILGKSGRLFNAHGKRICFILWIGCLLYWIARNYQLGLMVQMVGCFVSILLHIYGYYKWGKKKTVGYKFSHTASILDDHYVFNFRKKKKEPGQIMKFSEALEEMLDGSLCKCKHSGNIYSITKIEIFENGIRKPTYYTIKVYTSYPDYSYASGSLGVNAIMADWEIFEPPVKKLTFWEKVVGYFK